jgi:hypothetical protein
LVDDLAICCAFISQSSREGAQAEGQSLSHVFGFRFAVGQQLLHLSLNRRSQRSRLYVPLLRSGVAVGSKDAEQFRIGGDQRKTEGIL